LGSPATAGRVSAGHNKSWGKQGVSLEQYWADSAECAQAAADIDLEGTRPAKALVFYARLSDGNMGPNYLAHIPMPRFRPEVQWNRAATIMRNAIEGCLAGRGYVKFELTDEQDRRLDQLEAGSLERRSYLHSLASDPAVLAAQASTDS
jgi:hypothetical protein